MLHLLHNEKGDQMKSTVVRTVTEVDQWGDTRVVGGCTVDVTAGVAEYEAAEAEMADRWVPAGGGKEVPSRAKNGTRYLYVFNFATRQHGWLNLGTDVVELEDPFAVCCDQCQWLTEMERRGK
jgi:hypothetical protein